MSISEKTVNPGEARAAVYAAAAAKHNGIIRQRADVLDAGKDKLVAKGEHTSSNAGTNVDSTTALFSTKNITPLIRAFGATTFAFARK